MSEITRREFDILTRPSLLRLENRLPLESSPMQITLVQNQITTTLNCLLIQIESTEETLKLNFLTVVGYN